MRILVITNNPDRASFRQRVGIYLDALRAACFDCTVARFPSNPFVGWGLLRTGDDFDAIFLHKKRLNPFDAFVLRRCVRKLVYDFDDAVMYSDKRPDKPDAKRLGSFKRTVAMADVVIAGNEYLAEHARRFSGNVKILPTGLDVSEYDIRVYRPADGKLRLVWIGSKATLGYLREISPILEEIGARFDNVILRVICDEFIDLHNMEVEKRAWSQRTQARDLVECDIGLAPLPDNPYARGKCAFKILQYAAAGLPTVASPVGVSAQIVRDGVNGYRAVAAGDWVEKISALVNNEQLRKQMGLAARQMVRPFDCGVIGGRLVALVRETIHNQSVINGKNI